MKFGAKRIVRLRTLAENGGGYRIAYMMQITAAEGRKGTLRRPHQINPIYHLILSGMYMVFVFYDETELFVQKSAY